MPEIFIYEYDALAEKVQNNYKNYIEKPKERIILRKRKMN